MSGVTPKPLGRSAFAPCASNSLIASVSPAFAARSNGVVPTVTNFYFRKQDFIDLGARLGAAVEIADIHPLSAPNWYGMALVGSTRFIGRLKEMWEVHSLLHAGDVPQVSYALAATGGIGQVSGLGGVGKSLLAEE